MMEAMLSVAIAVLSVVFVFHTLPFIAFLVANMATKGVIKAKQEAGIGDHIKVVMVPENIGSFLKGVFHDGNKEAEEEEATESQREGMG